MTVNRKFEEVKSLLKIIIFYYCFMGGIVLLIYQTTSLYFLVDVWFIFISNEFHISVYLILLCIHFCRLEDVVLLILIASAGKWSVCLTKVRFPVLLGWKINMFAWQALFNLHNAGLMPWMYVTR